MTLTTIEKAAKLMGISINCQNLDDEKYYLAATGFNPYTNKADLSDVIDELGIDIEWATGQVSACLNLNLGDMRIEYIRDTQYLDKHPNKFTARANAVMAVVEQIYDAKFGKDGE